MIELYDIHTHIVPDVDDGSVSLNETYRILLKEYQDGVRCIIATPHFRRQMFEPDMAKVEYNYELTKRLALKIDPKFRIILGCEFHANMEMVEILKNHERPTIGNTNFVLTEFSGSTDWRFIQERINALVSNGYRPIIAHAERYEVFYKDIDKLSDIAQMGAHIQMNVNSICGIDGLRMKNYCRKVMKADLLDFVATDVHNTTDRPAQMGKCCEYLEKTMGYEYMKKILHDNPKNILKL